MNSPLIHGVVDQGVDTGVGHGQPVERQEHVWCVPGLHDGGVEEGVHEVDVIGQPADGKDKSHNSKHFYNLNSEGQNQKQMNIFLRNSLKSDFSENQFFYFISRVCRNILAVPAVS